jgi:hypothetical protein
MLLTLPSSQGMEQGGWHSKAETIKGKAAIRS